MSQLVPSAILLERQAQGWFPIIFAHSAATSQLCRKDLFGTRGGFQKHESRGSCCATYVGLFPLRATATISIGTQLWVFLQRDWADLIRDPGMRCSDSERAFSDFFPVSSCSSWRIEVHIAFGGFCGERGHLERYFEYQIMFGD